MNLESWLIEVLDDIRQASLKGENFDLHLESPIVKDIAEAYDKATWIEVY